MLYRAAKSNSHSFSAYAVTLRDLKATLEGWYPQIIYKLDEYGEGWAYVDGNPMFYLDKGHVEK